MDASRRWRLAVLGTPKLTAPDGRAFRCEGRTLALLTYLSLEGPVPRARLATLLWPDRAESASRNNLVQLLRRMTGTYGEALVLATDTLTLAPQVQVDARDVLGGAVDVLDGVLLDHDRFEEMPDFSDWLEVQREQLDQRRAHLLVERAARLEAQGEYGQAVEVAWRALSFDPVSESVHRRVMRLLYLDGQPTQALRVYERLRDVLREALRTEPMPETRELARLIGRSEQLPLVVPARSPARVVPTTTVLTGREREWAALERAWQDGRFIIVRGEAGMGKSRLALDFAQSKGRVLTLEGRPGDHLAPYTTAARNVRRVLNLAKPDLPDWARRSLTWLLPDLAVSGEAPLERADARLHDAIRSVFQVGLAQVDVCLFDDIHYVDDATIEAGFVLIDAVFPLGRPGGLPHFVAVHRDDELSPFTRSVFEGMVSAGQAAWIELGALDEDAARALLMNLNVTVEGALASTLVQAAGGNPLFLLEGVQSLRDAPPGEGGAPPLPGKVGALITRRLSRLSNVAVHAARASAVLRRDFSPELVAAMLSAPLLEVVAAWEELEAAQIVRGERFVHDLIGEAIFTDIPSATRRLLQRAAARVLAEHGAPPAVIARYWLDAGLDTQATPWLLRAARAAQASLRLREAAAHFDHAARLLHAQGDPDAAFEVWVQAARALAPSDDRELRQCAVNVVLERASTPVQAALAWQLQAEVFNMCGEGRRAEVAARRGLDALAGHAAPEVHANLLADLGAAFWAQDRGVEARDALEEAVRRLEPLGETEALASNLSSLAVVLDHQDRHREAEGYHRRACALLERLGDTANLLVALRNLSVCLSDLGRVREALGLLERARTLEGNAEGLWSSPTGHALLAFAYADLGEYSAALASFAQARALGERPHVWLPAYYRACEAEVWLTLGEVERARPLLSAALDVPEMPDTFRLRALLSLARLEVSRGEDGTDLLETARALLDEGGGGRPLWRARYLLARAEASTPLEALRYAQGALDVARTHELGQYELTAELRVTRALLTLGRHADALTHAERAARLLEHVTAADMTRGEALLIVHDARRSNGRADAAATLEDARRWLRDTAERHVPEGARERFVRAHPVHRALTNGATNANG